MNTNPDILERLRIDPGLRTIGQLLQDSEAALLEIVKLRSNVERLHTMRSTRTAFWAVPSAPSAQQHALRSGALVRLSDVCELIGVCQSTVYRWTSEGSFPEPVHIGERAVRWRIDDLER